MSLKGAIQGLDENGDPKQVVLSPAAAAAVEHAIPLFAAFPYLLQTGLAYLNKCNDYPCPYPVTEDYSLRHFAEMIVSILVLHGYDPDLLAQHPTAVQVIHDWACRMRTPDPHGFIDAFAARLQATPPMPTYSFTDQHVMRFSAILIMALGTVQGGRDTSLAAEAAFQQLPPRLPRTFVPTSTLAAPPSPCPPPAPCSATHSRSSLLDDRGPP